jgi:CRISPR/Cas system-associated exonuclease Cas4 (RecB family)
LKYVKYKYKIIKTDITIVSIDDVLCMSFPVAGQYVYEGSLIGKQSAGGKNI